MAIARITNRSYGNFYDPQASNFLVGNVGDIISASIDIEVEISATSGLGNEFVVTNNDTITRNIRALK